jgi:hypothetical protein
MPLLPEISCFGCHRQITSEAYTPTKNGGAPQASDYESCLRRCDACGFGFSNANVGDSAALTIIYRDPFWDVPKFIEKGYARVLSKSLNERNRPSKLQNFFSSNSEDHVTWTIFQHLVRVGEVASVVRRLGLVAEEAQEPTVLLWGVPISPGGTGRSRLKKALDSLGERQNSRSEPDIILDFGTFGLVFIEVKLRSANPALETTSPKWKRYIDKSDAFLDAEKAGQSGLYELIRDWRILCEVAGDAPATLINLGPEALASGEAETAIDLFRASVNLATNRRFMTVSWDKFLEAIEHPPLWLNRYIRDRRILGSQVPTNRSSF